MQNNYITALGILVAAVAFVWSFKRFGLPPVLAYLATGLVAGPYGLGWMGDSEEIRLVAELGIVFLLFSLGLEFSLPRLMAMRQIVFGLGSAQVILTAMVLMLILVLCNFSLLSAFTIASLLALSSTAVVVKTLKESGQVHKRRGQLAIGVLLFQDLAVVPLLIALPLIADNAANGLWPALVWAFFKGAVVCALLWAMGKWLLPKLFNEVAQVRTEELFVLTTILVALFASGLTHLFGLSMALGAFLAGMMLGESQYRHQLEADIRPFRDILMGLFFVTVGMQLDLSVVREQGVWILFALAVLLLIKFMLITIIAQMMGERRQDALAAGVMLCQMGEFGFVLIALAHSHALLDAGESSFLIAIGVISMAITPYLIDKTPMLVDRFFTRTQRPPKGAENASLMSDHVLICGYGRVGQTVARFLKAEAIPYLAIDVDPLLVHEAQVAGDTVLFGNARHKDILKSAGVTRARLVIITFSDFEKAQIITDALKSLDSKVQVLVRMQDDSHMEALKACGVTEVVPESLEGSLMLVSHVLFMSGVPMKRILRRVSKERENRYGFLHGFYPGESQPLDPEQGERLEYLHAVALPDNAYAVGKRIDELALSQRKVSLAALRRDGQEIENPSGETELLGQDILVLQGKPRRVERAERFLLDGGD